jgi:Family of unknown function (DUF6152)
MNRRLGSIALFTVLAFGVIMPSTSAHHAFGSEFDANAPILIKGKIAKIEWVNPHTWIHVETVKVDDGKETKETWMVEGGSPNTLLRRGANKNTFPEGTEVVVDGYQARDHTELRANARNVTFKDGRKLFLGSTGTGAPDAEAFNADKAKKQGKDPDLLDLLLDLFF